MLWDYLQECVNGHVLFNVLMLYSASIQHAMTTDEQQQAAAHVGC
jgi:hypothetical protein